MSRKQAFPATCLLVTAVMLTFGAALARDGRPDVKVNVVAMKEVVQRDASGKETVSFAQAADSGPGDTLVYQIVYSNQGTAPAHQAQVVDPIPSGTLLMPNSWDARDAEFAVSIDGGRTFETYPVRRPARLADGTTAMKDVELSAYTHVRWTSTEPLAPGANRSAAFKVKVR